MDVGSADIAGENICHPCRLGIRILAADGLEQRVSLSSVLLVNNGRNFIGGYYSSDFAAERYGAKMLSVVEKHECYSPAFEDS